MESCVKDVLSSGSCLLFGNWRRSSCLADREVGKDVILSNVLGGNLVIERAIEI